MINPIKNEKQHKEYLARVYELMQLALDPGSKESDELELLSILVESYEKTNYPIDSANPIDAILFRLDQLGMEKEELRNILGSSNIVSDVFSGKRKLSLSMIRKLNQKLGIPAESLIRDYEPNKV